MPKRKIDWYGPRLREVREGAGLSQAELGKRVDLAGSQINKLETNVNQPTLATALAIAEALGVPLTDFLPTGHLNRAARRQPNVPAPPEDDRKGARSSARSRSKE